MRSTRIFLPAVLMSCLTLSALAQSATEQIASLEKQISATGATRDNELQLARLYLQVDRYYEARQIADRILSSNPSDTDASSVRADAVAGLRKYEEQKVAAAEEATRPSGATDADRLALADAYYSAGRYLSAADLYAALPREMQTPEVRLRQARSLAWGGRLYDAEPVYASLIAGAHEPTLDVEYGRVLSWMGASKAALETLTAAYKANPSEEAVIALANARSWSGDREGAVALLREYEAEHGSAPEVARLMSDISASPDLQLERVDREIELEPFNLALQVERARLLVAAGRYSDALRSIRFVEEHSHDRIAGLDELKTTAEKKRDEEVAALSARLDAIRGNPQDAEAIHSLAKSYVGVEQYSKAISLYERYLDLRPDDTQARIEYARVLGWDRRYEAAASQYQKILAASPDRADLRLEYAQILSYDQQYVPAIHTFRALTDLSDNQRARLYADVPERAHYSLGQIYRWYGWNEHAVAEQNAAIALDGDFGPARHELDLVRHLRPSSYLDGTYTNAEDSNDFRLQEVDFSGEKWTSQTTAVDALVGRHTFERLGDQVSANAVSVGGKYRWQDRWLARANIGGNFYDEGLGARPYWNLGAEWMPNIQSRAALDYNHYDLVYDVFTLASLRQSPLSIDDLRGHYDYNSGGFWSALADASYGRVSDDNNRLGAHGLLTFRLWKEPFIALKADYRYLSYDFRSSRYWSPNDYHSIAGVAQIGQNLRNRIFWSAEVKFGRAYEANHTSDIRAIGANVTVPITDALDLIGAYDYGRSGRLDSVFSTSNDFVTYWQRRFYVGVRVKGLFRGEERKRSSYYFDDHGNTASPVIPPLGETR